MSGYDFLAGINVLEVAQLGPSALGGYLADLGATVIKVEGLGGDSVRRSGTPALGSEDGYGFLHLRWNRGKKSVNLNLKSPEGLDLFRQLARQSDVVIEGMRAGLLDRLGIGYDELRKDNPRIVFCSISGFGRTGPYSHLGSHGPAYDAIGGLGAHNPYGDVREDVANNPHVSVGMYAVGLHAALGTLAAVVRAQRTGEGGFIEVAASDSAAHWLPAGVDPFLNEDKLHDRPGFAGRTGKMVNWPRLNAYPTKDGRAIYFQSTEEKFWNTFCSVIDRPDLIEHYERATDVADADEEMYVKLGELFLTRTLDEWMRICLDNDIAASPVNTPKDVISDPHFVVRDNTYQVEYPGVGTVTLMGTPIKTPGQSFAPELAPDQGEHTDDVLRGMLGLDAAELARLRRSGAIG